MFTILNSDRGSARYNTHELPQATSNHFPDSMFQTFIMSECYLCSSPSFYQFRAPARRWLVFTSQAKPQILPQMANCCHSFLCVCACVYGWPFFSFPVIHCKKKRHFGHGVSLRGGFWIVWRTKTKGFMTSYLVPAPGSHELSLTS